MGCISTSVATRLCPSVRGHLVASVTVASAGILALGLVAVPPDVDVARSEVQAVRLATVALPRAADLGPLEKFIGDQSRIVVPIANAVGAVVDIPAVVVKSPTAGVTAPLTVDTSTDPAINTQKADATALAATTPAFSIPAPLMTIIGTILLFAPLILLVVLACPPCALINFLSYIPSLFGIYLPVLPLAAAASTATVEATATVDPTLTNENELPLKVTEIEKADVSEPVTSVDKRNGTERETSTEPATGNEQMSTDTATSVSDVVETSTTDEPSTEPTATSIAEPSASDEKSETPKLTERPATSQPVVRDSLGSDDQRPGLPQRGNGAAKAESASDASSSAASSSTEGKTWGNDSPGSDADGSD